MIFDLVAAADVVLNTGHMSGAEALRVCEAASKAGVSVSRMVPSKSQKAK